MKGAGTVDLKCGNGSPSLPSSLPTKLNDRKLLIHYSFLEFTSCLLFNVLQNNKIWNETCTLM